jgi:hypothetical protein
VATLRDHFETDFGLLAIHQQTSVLDRRSGLTHALTTRVHFDFGGNVFFASVFIPAEAPIEAARVLIMDTTWINNTKGGVGVIMGSPGESPLDASALPFSGRVFLYIDRDVPPEEKQALETVLPTGIAPRVRDRIYVAERAAASRPLAFIAHDSRDKEAIAKPLADGLLRLMCPVWFDAYSLKPGDRLRESVEKGLRDCARCVLIITPRFLSNTGWTREEFNAVFTREILEQRDIVLPVWYEVTARQVFEYSPALANRVAVMWELGVDEVCRRLRQVIGPHARPS